jgi:hypothetical protein
MKLPELVPELILDVASYISQADLLNLALTCNRLRDVTEAELYREYNNSREGGRSLKPFILRLLDRPELARHVQYADVRISEPSPHFRDDFLPEYGRLFQAAVATGIIVKEYPLHLEDELEETGRRLERPRLGNVDNVLEYLHMGSASRAERRELLSDRDFQTLLLQGEEEAFFVLLLAMLPNIRELEVHGVPHNPRTLMWRNGHHFEHLRHLTIRAIYYSGNCPPLGLFKHALQGGRLETLQIYSPGSRYAEFESVVDLFAPITSSISVSLAPNSTRITHLMLQNCHITYGDMKVLLYVWSTSHTVGPN